MKTNYSLLCVLVFGLAGTTAQASNAPITLPPGQTSISLSGDIFGSIRHGGVGEYFFFDSNDNLFRGTAWLDIPINNQPYTMTAEARSSSGESILLTSYVPTIYFTDNFSDGSGRFVYFSGNTYSASIVGIWDKTGTGNITVSYANFSQVNSVIPEPSTIYLLGAGLALFTSVCRGKRR